jgi:hypothetical protein
MMRYRVESIPKRKKLERSFATRLGAEAYCAALFYIDKLGSKIIDTEKPKEPEPEEATF